MLNKLEKLLKNTSSIWKHEPCTAAKRSETCGVMPSRRWPHELEQLRYRSLATTVFPETWKCNRENTAKHPIFQPDLPLLDTFTGRAPSSITETKITSLNDNSCSTCMYCNYPSPPASLLLLLVNSCPASHSTAAFPAPAWTRLSLAVLYLCAQSAAGGGRGCGIVSWGRGTTPGILQLTATHW